MDRFIALTKRLQDKKNEELFPICVEQIADYFVADCEQYGYSLLHHLKDFIISKQIYKRQLAAALFEKIILKIN